ncbi:MAG: hypothetical protein IJ561_03675 [Ruminococcus sp.]|nr:hypothetical protein [Ruminococcus sp.]
MKKIAALLLCISLLTAPCLTAYAEANSAPGEATIGTVVPDSHKVKVKVTGNVDFSLNGETGDEFTVPRLSEPKLKVTPKPGERITSVTLDGEDITDKLKDGTYTLPPVYEDTEAVIEAVTEKAPGENGGSTVNPTTGVVGGISVSAALLTAFVFVRRKGKEE